MRLMQRRQLFQPCEFIQHIEIKSHRRGEPYLHERRDVFDARTGIPETRRTPVSSISRVAAPWSKPTAGPYALDLRFVISVPDGKARADADALDLTTINEIIIVRVRRI